MKFRLNLLYTYCKILEWSPWIGKRSEARASRWMQAASNHSNYGL